MDQATQFIGLPYHLDLAIKLFSIRLKRSMAFLTIFSMVKVKNVIDATLNSLSLTKEYVNDILTFTIKTSLCRLLCHEFI